RAVEAGRRTRLTGRFVTLVVRWIGAWPPAGWIDRGRAARLRKPDSGHIDTISMSAGWVWLLWSERRPADRAATGPMPHRAGPNRLSVTPGRSRAAAGRPGMGHPGRRGRRRPAMCARELSSHR